MKNIQTMKSGEKKSFQRRKRCWMILIYAVKAPLHCRAGPSKLPLRLRAWFWMTATLNFKIVVHSVCCQQYHLLWCWELCQAEEHLSRQGPGLTSAEPPCCRHLPSMQEDQMPLSFFSYPCSQTGWSRWLTPWPASKPQRHPGADMGMTRGHGPEMPSLGPSQVLMPQPHRHPHGPFLTTDSVLRASITTVSTHLKSVGSGCSPSFPHPGASGSPWCLSWRSQQCDPLLRTSPQPFCSSLSLHCTSIFIFNLLSSTAASTWHGWGYKLRVVFRETLALWVHEVQPAGWCWSGKQH